MCACAYESQDKLEDLIFYHVGFQESNSVSGLPTRHCPLSYPTSPLSILFTSLVEQPKNESLNSKDFALGLYKIRVNCSEKSWGGGAIL